MGAIIANVILASLALGVLAVAPPAFSPRAEQPAVEPSQPEQYRLVGKLIVPEAIEIATSRSVEVVEIHVAPGDAVKVGDPLIVLRDLSVIEKRTEVRSEITRLETNVAGVLARTAAVERVESRARLVTLRQIEQDYESAKREFDRRQELFDAGLLARVEYEKFRDELESKRQELAVSREAIDRPTPVQGGQRIEGLEPARRMLERLETLPDTFVLDAPLDAVVEQILVAPGDAPERGARLMDLLEDRPARLVAELPNGVTGLRVVKVCGQGGPVAFRVEGRRIILETPPPSASAERPCEILIEAKP